jgi:hypothetical protein
VETHFEKLRTIIKKAHPNITYLYIAVREI